MNRNRRSAPSSAVVENAANVSLTSSCESQSYWASRVRQPMISMMTADRHAEDEGGEVQMQLGDRPTASREPISGNARYAGSLAAS
jgi:hypothetical protein